MNSMVALGKKFTRNIQDNKRRLLSAKYELRRKLYKAFVQDPQLPPEMREAHQYKLAKLPRNSSFTRIRNRCIFTGCKESFLVDNTQLCFMLLFVAIPLKYDVPSSEAFSSFQELGAYQIAASGSHILEPSRLLWGKVFYFRSSRLVSNKLSYYNL
ncbi:hypothetical protein RDI58_011899 [Solanum bulbocastanum]|uniref:Small ribosomal subunit protein uS14m n=1 Tax=Solanum bulbocastanum TaxID=147425 RepID=A0AAN8TY57_SOLBU